MRRGKKSRSDKGELAMCCERLVIFVSVAMIF